MKVFVLFEYDYGGAAVLGVYSSMEKATEVRNSQEAYHGNLDVLEFELDAAEETRDARQD